MILVKFLEKGYRMYKWNTTTDMIEPGQWLMNGRISMTKCEVNADCSLVRYRLSQHDFKDGPQKVPDKYDITSIPPYFSAVAIHGNEMKRRVIRGGLGRQKWTTSYTLDAFDSASSCRSMLVV